jgi:hypothetical protein
MKVDNFKARLKNKIWRMIKDRFYDQRIADTAIIQNMNYSSSNNQKKAVVCYLTTSYIKDWESNNIGRTQPFEILAIAKVLGDAGYSIDIIDCNDTKSLPYLKEKNYDLIFGFGETFYQLTQKHPEAESILYMTEHHPDFADREEKKRIAYFYERHKKKARIVRSGNFYKSHYFNQLYSHVITMSEVEPFLKEYQTPFTLFPTGVLNDNFSFSQKDQKKARKHFLWLGSYGAVHKGLDLLLDVFENRDDIILHIAGLSKEDEKLLNPKKKTNIINHGYINIKTDTFLKVVETCSFVILPSCSEGCSTAITTGMLHGMIPIVMKDAGFNRLQENTIFLNDYKVAYIDQKLTEISAKSILELEHFSESIYKFAHKNFLPDYFERNFKKIIETILKEEAE